MAPRDRPPTGRKVLNVRNIPDTLRDRLWQRKIQQGRIPFAAYLARLEQLHAVIEREANKRADKDSVRFARTALKAAGLLLGADSG